MIKYTWRVKDLERYAQDGGIFKIRYRLIAEVFDHADDNIGTGQMVLHDGEVNVVPDPASVNFIPFEDLTENDVINFIEDNLNAEIESLKQTLQADLESPETLTGIPWS